MSECRSETVRVGVRVRVTVIGTVTVTVIVTVTDQRHFKERKNKQTPRFVGLASNALFGQCHSSHLLTAAVVQLERPTGVNWDDPCSPTVKPESLKTT